MRDDNTNPGVLPPRAQAQLLHLGLQALSRDLELARGLRDVPAGLVERALNQLALDETGGNVTQAARKLKISRKSLQNKMKEFGLRDEK